MDKKSHFKSYIKGIFTRKKAVQFLISDVLGNFIGFAAGFFTSSMFTHYVTEKKSINNLFGLLKRKQYEVNDTPGWLHWLISLLIGFLVMETFRYVFYEKNYLIIWNRMKGSENKPAGKD
ncbi:MAG: hypothetical protein JWO44_911 [Bacteroidetes bacterium]|jgi:hypothetical protein|nr:hypothetical protein [Bacteroidota bacterium]